MTKEEVLTLVRLGFEPSHYFKRGAWNRVTGVMEFLANKELVQRTPNESVKYKNINWQMPSETEKMEYATAYWESPYMDHEDELRELSHQTGLPLNSKELLNHFFNQK